jgi:hypothetical protein
VGCARALRSDEEIEEDAEFVMRAGPIQEAELSWSVADADSLLLHGPARHYVTITGASPCTSRCTW